MLALARIFDKPTTRDKVQGASKQEQGPKREQGADRAYEHYRKSKCGPPRARAAPWNNPSTAGRQATGTLPQHSPGLHTSKLHPLDRVPPQRRNASTTDEHRKRSADSRRRPRSHAYISLIPRSKSQILSPRASARGSAYTFCRTAVVRSASRA